MPFATVKLVVAMMNFEVLIRAYWCCMPTENGLRCDLGAVRNNLRKNFLLALQNTKINRFTIRTSISFTPDTLHKKIRFIDYCSILRRRFKFSTQSYSLSNYELNCIGRLRIEIPVNYKCLIF